MNNKDNQNMITTKIQGTDFTYNGETHYEKDGHDRARSAFKLTVVIGTGFLVISTVVLYIFSEYLITLMSKDSEVISIGVQILKMQCITIPLLAYYAISSMLMQNIGKYFWSLIISISRQGIFYIPLLYLLTNLYGKLGIYLLQPIADIFSFVLLLLLFIK